MQFLTRLQKMGFLSRFKKATEEKHSQVDSARESMKTAVAGPQQELTMIGRDSTDIIVKPYITEKTASLAGSNQYVFVVRIGANRHQVRRAIKQMYGVEPLSVNIVNMRGKKMRFGRRAGTRSDWKKAIITLPKGHTMKVYEGV